MPSSKVVLLPGDGVGPEIVAAATRVLDVVAPDLEKQSFDFGGAAIDRSGHPLPEATLEACKACDAILLGAIGGPKWDGAEIRPEAGLLGLRKALDLFCNLRPVKPIVSVAAQASPLRPERLENVDILIVRELTGDLYFGRPRWRKEVDGVEQAIDTAEYSRPMIERIAEVAFRAAKERRGVVTSVDKANVLATSKLWRDVMTETATQHEGVELRHQLVDSAALKLLTEAQSFDVLVTSNMFGDILSDEAAALTGSLGLPPSASLGRGTMGMYEPIHGSAPDIAGQGIANPVGTILSAALMLRHSLGRSEEAAAIEAAVERALDAGARTKDIGGSHSTDGMTDAVIAELKAGGK